jgi:hypothetical protein
MGPILEEEDDETVEEASPVSISSDRIAAQASGLLPLPGGGGESESPFPPPQATVKISSSAQSAAFT